MCGKTFQSFCVVALNAAVYFSRCSVQLCKIDSLKILSGFAFTKKKKKSQLEFLPLEISSNCSRTPEISKTSKSRKLLFNSVYSSKTYQLIAALQCDCVELKELGEYVSQYRGFKKNIFPYKNESDLSTLWTTDMATHMARRSRGELRGRKQHVKSVFFFFPKEAAGM